MWERPEHSCTFPGCGLGEGGEGPQTVRERKAASDSHSQTPYGMKWLDEKNGCVTTAPDSGSAGDWLTVWLLPPRTHTPCRPCGHRMLQNLGMQVGTSDSWPCLLPFNIPVRDIQASVWGEVWPWPFAKRIGPHGPSLYLDPSSDLQSEWGSGQDTEPPFYFIFSFTKKCTRNCVKADSGHRVESSQQLSVETEK